MKSPGVKPQGFLETVLAVMRLLFPHVSSRCSRPPLPPVNNWFLPQLPACARSIFAGVEFRWRGPSPRRPSSGAARRSPGLRPPRPSQRVGPGGGSAQGARVARLASCGGADAAKVPGAHPPPPGDRRGGAVTATAARGPQPPGGAQGSLDGLSLGPAGGGRVGLARASSSRARIPAGRASDGATRPATPQAPGLWTLRARLRGPRARLPGPRGCRGPGARARWISATVRASNPLRSPGSPAVTVCGAVSLGPRRRYRLPPGAAPSPLRPQRVWGTRGNGSGLQCFPFRVTTTYGLLPTLIRFPKFLLRLF